MITYDDDIRIDRASPAGDVRHDDPAPAPDQPRPDSAITPPAAADEGERHSPDRRMGIVSLAATVALALIAMMVVATRVLGGEPAPSATADRHLIAAELHDVVERSAGVRVSSIAYVEGVGIVAYSAVDGVGRADLAGWAAERIAPIATRLAGYPADDELIWLVDASADGGFTESLVAPLTAAADASSFTLRPAWRQTRSSAPNTPMPTSSAAPAMDASAAATEAPAEAQSPAADPAPTPAEAPAETDSVPPAGAPTASADAPSDATSPLAGSLSFDFSAGADEWSALSGVWRVVDGSYRQLDDSGYDFASYLLDEVVSEYELEVQMRALDGGVLNAGVMLNRPTGSDRAGTTMVDLTERGSFLRWGHFDENGRYTYIGGVPVERAGDPTRWVSLRVAVRGTSGLAWIDDEYVGEFPLYSDQGRIGLVTSVAAVEFDELVLSPIRAEQG